MNTVCKRGMAHFERTPDGKWVCKMWAMKGPTSSMMDKEVPEPWCLDLEKDYQTSLNFEGRFPPMKIVGVKKEDGSLIPAPKHEPKPKKKAKKPAGNREPKPPKNGKINKKKSGMMSSFNPFDGA